MTVSKRSQVGYFKKKSITKHGNMNVNSAETGLVENSRIIPYEALNFIDIVISSLYRKNKFNLFLNPYSTRTVNFAMHSVRIFSSYIALNVMWIEKCSI
jgi:hypothetical protein